MMISREDAVKKLYALTPPNRQSLEGLIDEIYDSIIPEDVDAKDPWAWVKLEYCALFKAKNPDKGGKVRESVARMKTMFRAMPEIRKEDVILTVKMYLSQTDSRFIRYPHYFLKKGQGANAIYEFADWYDKYLEAKEKGTGRTNVVNTMQ
jgi:hypothetical protein